MSMSVLKQLNHVLRYATTPRAPLIVLVLRDTESVNWTKLSATVGFLVKTVILHVQIIST